MSGRGRSRVVAAWLLGVALVALLGVELRDARQSAGRRVGVTLRQTARGVELESVERGLPAERAGLRPGDLLLELDGRPVARVIDYDAMAAAFARGRDIYFRAARGDQALTIRVEPGAAVDWLPLLLDGLVALCYLGLGILALLRGGDDRRAQLLALFSLAVAFELALPLGSIGDTLLSAVAFVVYYLLTGLQIALELHLASVLPEPQGWLQRRPWIVRLFYGCGLVVGVFGAVSYLGDQILPANPLPWSSARADQLLFDLGLPLWALVVAGLLALPALRHPRPQGRHQAALVLSGVLPWAIYVVARSLLDAAHLPLPVWLDSLEPLILLCYPAAVFWAIFRWQLFDIELAIRRSLIYSLLTGSLILCFYAALGAGGAVFSNLVEGSPSVWVVAAATLLLGLLFSPLRRALQRLIDRRFFPERHALRRRLTGLAGELPALGKLPRMGEHLVARLSEIFGVRSVSLLIADPRSAHLGVLASTRPRLEDDLDRSFLLASDDPGIQALRRSGRPQPAPVLARRSSSLGQRLGWLGAALVVPLTSQRELVGLLALGEKASGRGYVAEEIELLDLVSHHVATVFENARLFESATYEGLTGLLRREAILEQLQRELARAQRYDRPLTVGLADLDHFKEVNDRWGHLAGDALLKRVAQAMSGVVRGSDAIGRYGGEEFLLVLPETPLAAARVVAEKMRGVVAEARVQMEDGAMAEVTVSIGLASREELEGAAAGRRGSPTGVRELIAAADLALYNAKRAGRNRIHPAA
jgi:diguanylate cyclase (GGDEF)-like protein